MNPGSAYLLVTTERRATQAKFQSVEIGGGAFTQAIVDARRAKSRSSKQLSSGLPRAGAFVWAVVLQLANIAHPNHPVATNNLH